ADAVVFEFGDLLAVHEPGEFAGFPEQAEDVVAVGGGAVVDLRGAPLLVVGAVAVPVHGDAVAAGAPLGEDFHDVDFHGAVAGVAALPLVQPGVGAAVGHHPVGGPEAADVGDLDAGLEVTVELAPLVVALNEAGGVVAGGALGVIVFVAEFFFGFEGGDAVGDGDVFRSVALELAGLGAVPREAFGPEFFVQRVALEV